jgi:HK97 family phage prohead protease
LADHQPTTDRVLGTIHHAEETDTGLVIRAAFASTDDAQRVRTKMIEGHLGKLSIGYESASDHMENRDGVNVRVLDAIKLHEVSVVVFPMNPLAVVTGVKSHGVSDDGLGLAIALAEAELGLVALRR